MTESIFRPFLENENRNEQASERRSVASRFSRKYAARSTGANNDEQGLASAGYACSFTKGLPHDEFSLLKNNDDYLQFVKEINQQDASDFSKVPSGIARGDSGAFESCWRAGKTNPEPENNEKWRGWESPRTGHYFDLQGPDADAVGMPMAPELGSEELSAEMAELYALALLRDVPFAQFTTANADLEEAKDDKTGISARRVFDALEKLSWFNTTRDPGSTLKNLPDNDPLTLFSLQEHRRLVARRIDHGPDFDIDAPPLGHPFEVTRAFRGSAPGAKTGPFVSQFMLLGNEHTFENGTICEAAIAYGIQLVDQKFPSFPPHCDYVIHWNAYLDVQRGANFSSANRPQDRDTRHFIATPRDLATYVKFDALYQAYLNACLLMLGEKSFKRQQPVVNSHSGNTGPGFPDRDPSDSRQAFASFGGPHVLSLVTEVATRCLKAVRRQKFNYHRRARPERVAAFLTLLGWAGDNGQNPCNDDHPLAESRYDQLRQKLRVMTDEHGLADMLELVAEHNTSRRQDGFADVHLNFDEADKGKSDVSWLTEHNNYLLPMAFAEGSPMHPSYGAGHATVAGGCVTMLKAFFNTTTTDENGKNPSAVKWPDKVRYVQASDDGRTLVDAALGEGETATIAGELNKLAANIAIARDMAGVHYYTDYYESLRMGERVATGILIEQLKQYNEPVEMDFQSFDGDHVHILKTDYDYSDPRVFVHDSKGTKIDFSQWWLRHLTGDDKPATETPITEKKAQPIPA